MTQLPEKSSAWPDVEARMKAMAARDVKWRDGKTAIYVFNAGPEVEHVKKAAYAMFSEENGLGPAAFPSLAQMEREVVAFGLALMHAPPGGAGSMTSGGTEFHIDGRESCARFRPLARPQRQGQYRHPVFGASGV